MTPDELRTALNQFFLGGLMVIVVGWIWDTFGGLAILASFLVLSLVISTYYSFKEYTRKINAR